MSTIQIRIDEKTKNSAKKIIEKMGMDISSAIKIYLRQIIITKSVPFIITENGFTTSEEKAINKAAWEAKRGINIVKTNSWEELKTHLDKLKKLSDANNKPQKFRQKISKTSKKNSTKS